MSKKTKRNSGAGGPPPGVPQLDLFADTPKFHSMIPIDREPILAEWREKYRALETELADLAKKSEEYQFEAVPAFQARARVQGIADDIQLFNKKLGSVIELIGLYERRIGGPDRRQLEPNSVVSETAGRTTS